MRIVTDNHQAKLPKVQKSPKGLTDEVCSNTQRFKSLTGAKHEKSESRYFIFILMNKLYKHLHHATFGTIITGLIVVITTI